MDVNTGIDLVTDGIYDFTIIVDPETLTYDAIVSDGTTTWDSRTNGFADGLGWRTAADNIGGWGDFQGVQQRDLTSYPGYIDVFTGGIIGRQCDHCRRWLDPIVTPEHEDTGV